MGAINVAKKKNDLISDVENYIKKGWFMADIKGKMEIIKEFIEKCPLLKGGKVNVDYLKSKTYSYSIDETPTTTIIQRFADGGCREQINFDLAFKHHLMR